MILIGDYLHIERGLENSARLVPNPLTQPSRTNPVGLVAENQHFKQALVLINNAALETIPIVQQVYIDWRLRGRIEHGYRFVQEQGLDVEDMRVQTLDRMRRLFVIILLSAQIVFVIGVH